MRRTALLLSTNEELPREALQIDFVGSGKVIQWIDLKTWEFLLEAKAYVEAYPDDISNKLVYRNLIRAYASNS